jgi:TetR/AcrR family transcriptional regulator, regulator of cefoperazone and chloramphenicol sensitivity
MPQQRSKSRHRTATKRREAIVVAVPRTQPGRRSGSDRTRARLVEVAGEMFAELGFHHTTVREICRRARANIAAVNYHFGGKRGLYEQVVRQSMRAARLEAVRAALDQGGPPEEVLRAVVKARLESLWGQELGDWHFRIIAHELAKPSPAMNQVVNEAIRPVYLRLCEVISRVVDLPPDHEKTRLCAHSIIGQILFYAFARPVIGPLWPEMKMTPVQVDLISDHIADFSLAYLRNARKGKWKSKSPGPMNRRI